MISCVLCLFIALWILSVVDWMIISQCCCILDLTEISMHPILALFLEEWLQVLVVTLVDVVFRGIRRHVLRILIRTIRLLLSSQLVNARWIFVKLLQLLVLFERCQVFSLWRVSKLGSCVH